jgi:DNA invertase Pin-like site-specific DNA recombinase
VHFRSLTEDINTATPGGKLVFYIFAAIAEFERGIILERTRAGIHAAQQRKREIRTQAEHLAPDPPRPDAH